MAVDQLEDLYEHGVDVTATQQDGQGTITAQTGDAVGGEVTCDNAEWWQHVGLTSRPAKPTAGAPSCQAITINGGRNDLVIATRDLRGPAIPLNDGETCLYAPGPSNKGTGRVLLQDDGTNATITITAGGAKIVIKASDGSITISGGPVNLAGASDFAALASKVDAAFNAVATTLASLTSPSGPVTAGTPFVPTPTAATQVKIS